MLDLLNKQEKKCKHSGSHATEQNNMLAFCILQFQKDEDAHKSTQWYNIHKVILGVQGIHYRFHITTTQGDPTFFVML
jgi:hypothetical protein